ncbi:MAG: phosphoribosylglycinamide formyltransferase [Candidatus Altiarchaeota archaeon]
MKKSREKLRIGVLVSGGGSNLGAIIEACNTGEIEGEVCVVLSDNKDAYGLERAKNHKIENYFVDKKEFSDREIFDGELVRILKNHHVELVCLAGYMRIISASFVKAFPNRIMNIHPALLPSFPGLHVQKKAVDYGVKVSGCTVHFVDEEVDHGPIIIQKAVPVLDDDDGDSLAARILKHEHRIYPEAIRLFAEDRLKVEGRRVIVSG